MINVALPYQDLPIMDACLETGVDYLDTANYEPRDVGEVRVQLAVGLPGPLREGGLMALLGSGFDPGVTNVFTALRCRSTTSTRSTSSTSSTATPAATASRSPPTSTPRSTSARSPRPAATGRTAQWIETDAARRSSAQFDFPEGVGPMKIYLMYHEELESLVKHFPTIRQRPVLDDLLGQLPEAPRGAAERRHDPHRPGRVRGAGDRAAAVPQGRCCPTRRASAR